MEFPLTYVDAARENFGRFLEDVGRNSELIAGALKGKDVAVTGTTIIAFLARNKKVGIVASDGRISMATYSAHEEFRKIFRCRVGFVGFAGALLLAQIVSPAFRKDIDMICLSRRGRLITASGAARRLFDYYIGVLGKIGSKEELSFDMIPLFWDDKNGRCHLYALKGMSHLDDLSYAYSGSGSLPIMSEIAKCEQTDSGEEMLQNARRLLRSAARIDMATNTKMSYGIIDNGEFFEGEEVL